jgi:hypothetical protein
VLTRSHSQPPLLRLEQCLPPTVGSSRNVSLAVSADVVFGSTQGVAPARLQRLRDVDER